MRVRGGLGDAADAVPSNKARKVWNGPTEKCCPVGAETDHVMLDGGWKAREIFHDRYIRYGAVLTSPIASCPRECVGRLLPAVASEPGFKTLEFVSPDGSRSSGLQLTPSHV